MLIASADFLSRLSDGGPPQTGWHEQAGWGMLEAHRALKLRYQILNDELASGQQKTWGCFTTPRMTMDYAKLRQPWVMAMPHRALPLSKQAAGSGSIDIRSAM